jgi:hypothetical protein
VRPRFISALSAIGALALLGASLSGCAAAGGPGWGGPSYYSGYYPGPGYYPGYYAGPQYQRWYYADRVDRYRTLPPNRFERPEVRPAPRTEHWSQERLRHYWCSQPGANCRG